MARYIFNIKIVLFVIVGVYFLSSTDNFVRLTQTMPWTKTLKQAFKAAMRTGRIKYDSQQNVQGEQANWQDNEMQTSQRLCRAELDETKWKEFENLDDRFRRNIATGNKRKAYKHPNPAKWLVVLNIIASTFIKDQEEITNHGLEWSVRKLKFAKRVLLKFPIKLPDVFDGECESQKEALLQQIVWCVNFVQQEISPCFNKKTGSNKAHYKRKNKHTLEK